MQITASARTIIDAKVALCASKLSDREKNQFEAAVDAHEKLIDESVFSLYGIDGLPK
ncbi:MAG TPA: hypothetical protein VMG59_06960 [Phycisphaerae bacterium]|nr:hypothetical protein [Phycisphaerae bacterium]